ncbi:MAG TPA: MarR family transcriptional regulator [Actinomycetales bacterium]|nr:MarR family transcriptional regulator [Actinomycetales bacterium]
MTRRSAAAETATSPPASRSAVHPEAATASSSPPMDEVDRIVAAWRRERPDLDVGPLDVLSRVSRLARHLDRARAAAFSEIGLEGWEFDVLSALRRAGEPYELSPGQLVTQTLVTSGTMTNRVDRLTARGLVERLPDPRDRRGVIVRLTDVGRSRVDDALAGLLARERDLLADLGDDEHARLSDLLRQLVLPFEPR